MATQRRGFGKIRQLPSMRQQASYLGPDGRRHVATTTFTMKGDAEAWLNNERIYMERTPADEWESPAQRAQRATETASLTVRDYCDRWFAAREKSLEPLTRKNYRRYLNQLIIPKLGDLALSKVTSADLRAWLGDPGTDSRWTIKHASDLLHTIFHTAWTDRIIADDPFVRIKVPRPKSDRIIQTATPEELALIADQMDERLRLAVLLMAWCAIRIGELAELRRKDVKVATVRGADGTSHDAATIHVRRQVQQINGEKIVKAPKAHSVGDVPVPDTLVPVVKAHLEKWCQPGPDGLMFPNRDGQQFTSSAFWQRFHRAAAKVDDLGGMRVHDLRHTGGTLAAEEGASLQAIMAWGRWASASAALGYQHRVAGSAERIAAGLSEEVVLPSSPE